MRNLNVYKIGTTLADTENIYRNISKMIGSIAGIIDFGKMIILLYILKKILLQVQLPYATDTLLFIYGMAMVIGHCLPVTHHFKGGRGIFTYTGLLTFFAPIPTLSVLVLAVAAILKFQQFRFAQYMIVLSTPILCYILRSLHLVPISNNIIPSMFIGAVTMGVINFILSKRLGEF